MISYYCALVGLVRFCGGAAALMWSSILEESGLSLGCEDIRRLLVFAAVLVIFVVACCDLREILHLYRGFCVSTRFVDKIWF